MSASEAPRLTAVVLLPTPPFWLTTAMMRGVPCPLVANAVALVDVALSALDQQVPLVPSRIIDDLFEQRAQDGAHPDIAAKAGGRRAALDQERNHVLARDGKIPHRERRFFFKYLRHPRFEQLVFLRPFGQATTDNIRVPQGKKTFKMRRSDAIDKTANRFGLQRRIGRIHVRAHEMFDRRDRLVRKPP